MMNDMAFLFTTGVLSNNYGLYSDHKNNQRKRSWGGPLMFNELASYGGAFWFMILTPVIFGGLTCIWVHFNAHKLKTHKHQPGQH